MKSSRKTELAPFKVVKVNGTHLTIKDTRSGKCYFEEPDNRVNRQLFNRKVARLNTIHGLNKIGV